VPLGFLEEGRQYRATVYADGRNADWRSNPYDYDITETRVHRDSVLGLNLAPGGGAAVRLRPADGGTQ